MAKTFGSKMESGENLGWCKPIVLTYKDKKAIIAQKDGSVAGLAIDGKISGANNCTIALFDHFGVGQAQLGKEGAESLQDLFNYEFDGASVEVEEELGCRECPFFAECDALNEEIEDDKNWLEDAEEIEIVSGEGTEGTTEDYEGKRTERAICMLLAKEDCQGDRWAYARIDGVRYDRDGYKLVPRY